MNWHAVVLALPLLVSGPPPPPPTIVLPLLPLPEEPSELRSRKRMDTEIAKCDAGMRSCNQHHIDYWRRRCVRDAQRIQ